MLPFLDHVAIVSHPVCKWPRHERRSTSQSHQMISPAVRCTMATVKFRAPTPPNQMDKKPLTTACIMKSNFKAFIARACLGAIIMAAAKAAQAQTLNRPSSLIGCHQSTSGQLPDGCFWCTLLPSILPLQPGPLKSAGS